MTQPQKQRLGRGLAALIGDNPDELPAGDARAFRQVPIELVFPNPSNPRRAFKEDELEELAGSIRQKGLLQPLVLRPQPSGQGYQIVAGERRWRAAQRARLHEVPALVRDLSDGEALEIALMENIQRADLNPIEEAEGYRQLMERFGHTQQQLAEGLGKSRSHIANTLRLLNLPDAVRAHVESGALTAGHARALVATESPAELARRIIEHGLSVRETEQLAKTSHSARSRPSPDPQRAPERKSADIKALEQQLSEETGLKVEIAHRDGAGHLTVRYQTLEQLDDVCRRLAGRG